jgi:hypothetical protein
MKTVRKTPFMRLIEPCRDLGGSLWSMFFATMIHRFCDFAGIFLALYLSRILGFDALEPGSTISLVSGRMADKAGTKAGSVSRARRAIRSWRAFSPS